MGLVKKILHKLNGLHYPQEYLCLARESFPQPLHVYLVSDDPIFPGFTEQHVFAGYKPVIFALHNQTNKPTSLPGTIQLAFTHQSLQPNDIFYKKDAIALLSMNRIKSQLSNRIVYYEAIKGKHQFLSGFHQSMINLNNRLYNKKPGNVFLDGNLYQQVQIAYSIPRNISLITVQQGNLYNLFPTDLHGTIGEDHYLVSLRHAGKACQQVEAAGKIVVSQMGAGTYKTVYSLGKNHMQEPKSKNYFPFCESNSRTFHLPLPEKASQYAELELKDSFIHGIHKLLLFKIIHKRQLTALPQTLSHIHNSYATWRHNNNLAGNYLLR